MHIGRRPGHLRCKKVPDLLDRPRSRFADLGPNLNTMYELTKSAGGKWVPHPPK